MADGTLGVNVGVGGPNMPGTQPGTRGVARATWTDTITNSSGGSLDYHFVFDIIDPRFALPGNDASYAEISINITLDGDVIWTAFAQMDGCSVSYSDTMGAPSTTDFCYADWASFTAEVNLGTFADGESFVLGYEMEVSVLSWEVSRIAYAMVGDPFRAEGTPIQIVTSPSAPAAVPAPAPLALFALGLAALSVGIRARRTA